MEKHLKGHNAGYLKRQAKKLKKELGITYTEALNKAAVNAGYAGWKNFLNKAASPVAEKTAKKKILLQISSQQGLHLQRFM